MKTTLKVLAIGVVLIATTTGCRSFTGRSAGEIVDNKTIVGTVKTKLVRDHLQNLTWVNVDAKNGVVYLTGNAETAAQKARATELAAETRGVKRVVNDIVVNSADADTAKAPARSASGTTRSSTVAPAASPVTASSPRAAAGSVTGEVVTVDQGSGDVTLRMAGGSDLQLRLPPSSVRNVRPGDRLSVSVNAAAK
jgi:hyperosmotically inducible periplasmic protein